VVTPAPSTEFNVNLVHRPIQALWIRRDIPRSDIEERLYRVALLNLVARFDPMTAMRFFEMPFIKIDDLAAALRASEYSKGRLIVDRVCEGYLIAPSEQR